MKQVKNLRENIFVEIGKMLALAQIRKEVPKAMKKLEEDPIIITALESLEFHANKLKDLLPEFCKRNPNSNLCKKKNK